LSVFNSLKVLREAGYRLEARGASVIMFRREGKKHDSGPAYNIATVSTHSNTLSLIEHEELSVFIKESMNRAFALT
jgi:hypothetical protein